MATAAPQKLSVEIRDLEGVWSPLQGYPAALLPSLPCLYPAFPCHGWHSPPPGSIAQPVPAPCCPLPGGVPLLWPLPPILCAGTLEDLRWGKAAIWRESTGALRAWLGQHLQHPYPSKGEKVLLAVLSQRSLTQVSTWFANARRRLKKEDWLRGVPRLLQAPGEDQEEAEDEDEEKKGQAGGEWAGPGSSPQPKRPQALWGSSGAADPWREPGPGPDSLPSIGQRVAERFPPEPKLRSTSGPATRPLPGKPPQWVWGLCPLRKASGLWEDPSCAPWEGKRDVPPPGSDPWGHPGEFSGAERDIALPPPSWCALEVLDYSPHKAQLACQLVMQACGSAHLESARLGKARASRPDHVAGSLLRTGIEGSPGTRRAARQMNPLGRWVELE